MTRVLIWIPVCPRCGETNYQPLGGDRRLCLECGQVWHQIGPPSQCRPPAAPAVETPRAASQ